jgi:threonine/homoserine/homoserine lactone efflux protein
MTLSDLIVLFLMLATMAALPSASVMLLVSRTLSSGAKHGVVVSFGIVLADLLYLLLAIFGLAVVARWLEQYWPLVQIMAALILLIFSLWHAGKLDTVSAVHDKHSTWVSFVAGFTLTAVDYKAIVFYLGILPIFINNNEITLSSSLILLITSAVAVASVKLTYVYLANRVQQHFLPLQKGHQIMSVMLLLTALWLMINLIVKFI